MCKSPMKNCQVSRRNLFGLKILRVSFLEGAQKFPLNFICLKYQNPTDPTRKPEELLSIKAEILESCTAGTEEPCFQLAIDDLTATNHQLSK